MMDQDEIDDTDEIEIDYLAGTERANLTAVFAKAVRLAFKQVHGCEQDKGIALLIDTKPPGLARIFRNPEAIKADTLRKILANFSSYEVRRRIVASWEVAAFGEGLASCDEERWEGPVLEWVKALMDSRQPQRALRVAKLALETEADYAIREGLFYAAIQLSFRLDEVIEQVTIARQLAEWGETSGQIGRTAMGLAVTARALRRSGAPRQETIALRDKAMALVGKVVTDGHEQGMPRFALDTIESENVHDLIELHESNGGQEETLRKLLMLAKMRVERASSPGGEERARILGASLHLALGEPFKAEELLGKAFKAGEGSTGRGVYAAILRGRILAARGENESAADYFRDLAEACLVERQTYLYRLSQAELSRLIAVT